MTNIIPINQARQHLGEIVEEAHFLSKPFMITRGNRPMAVLIGAKEFQALIGYLEMTNPGLADTLAIMTNSEIQTILEEGEKNVKKGKTIPFEKWLED